MKKVLVVLQYGEVGKHIHSADYDFDKLCKQFPECVRELTDEQRKRGPSWGTGWYDNKGFYKQQWDTSG